jgi:formylmethanofuran dehydrogenase subunit E
MGKCSECGEPAWDNKHTDGEPLCPVMGPDGYEPGEEVED